MTTPRRLLVRGAEAGRRLDVFLAEGGGLSRRRARVLIGEGSVWRNQRPTRVQSRTLEAGDIIDVLDDGGDLTAELWRPPPVDFIHHDRQVAIVNKASGVLTQCAEGERVGDMPLDERVLLNLALTDGRRPFLRTIHRLDRLTSGLVVFARSPKALKPLDRAWRSGKVERLYLAVVCGRMESSEAEIEVDAPIGRDPDHDWRFKVDGSGRPAVTRVRPLHFGADTTVVVCRLMTGRTHQVRVHLGHLGHPVLGDRLYGGARPGVDRPMLHAWALALPHPADQRRLHLEAPIPPALAERLEDLTLGSPWTLKATKHAD